MPHPYSRPPHSSSEPRSNRTTHQPSARHRRRPLQARSSPLASDPQQPDHSDDEEDQIDSDGVEATADTSTRCLKRGADSLRDALEKESQRKKRRGHVKYVLKARSLST